MAAVRLWVRADLRRRWISWVVLGVLAGLVVGLAAAGVAGARRTDRAVPEMLRVARIPDAGVLVNSPAFDEAARAKVAALPQVRHAYPFAVLIATRAPRFPDIDGALTPTTAAAEPVVPFAPLVDGRFPDPRRADEVIVSDATSAKHGLHLGSTFALEQRLDPSEMPPAFLPKHVVAELRQPVRVVGVYKSPDGEVGLMPSPGFYAKYRDELAALVNQFVTLRHGRAAIPAFERAASESFGSPINVVDFSTSLDKTRHITTLEEEGLLLFALAVLLGGGTLVGQALVRATTAPGNDINTFRSLGAEHPIAALAIATPAVLAASTAAAVAIPTMILLSSRFPLGVARRYDLDLGYHVDWPVLSAAVVVSIVGVLSIAGIAAALRVVRGQRLGVRASNVGGWAARLGLPPVTSIGSRLALEPGRGNRAVPVRSAIAGAIVGVLGVVACFTFRAGITDAITRPERSGTTWNYEVVVGAGTIPKSGLRQIARIQGVGAVLDVWWARTSQIVGRTVPTFGTNAVKGSIPFVMLHGRAPASPDEVALSPSAMRNLGASVGEKLHAGAAGAQTLRVTGEALLPSTSHTEYDEGAWMTAPGLRRILPPARELGADDIQDYALLRWQAGADAPSVRHRVAAFARRVGLDTQVAWIPQNVAELSRLRVLPLVLGVFLALLAIATLAHALVTTVRRRRHEFAVLRALGFTARQTRGAIAWQATLLAAIGLVVGVPLGIVVGRLVWRSLADSFPFVYAPPLALLAILVAVPIAILVANVLAAGPSRRAGQIQPAAVLRSE